MNKKPKKLVNIFVIIIFLFILGYLLYVAFQKPENGVMIHFFDVGQGDATLIETPLRQNVLIDGGPSDIIASKLDKTIPFYHRSLDAVILTHPHADHLTGLLKVVDSYEIKAFYLTGVTYNTPEYLELLSALRKNNIQTHYVIAGDTLTFGEGLRLDFLYPRADTKDKAVENINNTSIVTKLSWGSESILMTGDIENEEQSNLDQTQLKTTLLKVPHHCSGDGLSSKFLERASPKYAVISVGKDNKFGHPAQSCLSSLRSVQVFRTDQDGDIDFRLTKDNLVSVN